MNELMRCLNVFTHSPFQVRLRLLNMLCDTFNPKPQPGQDDNGQQ
ncbi:manganase accumulation protein MntS [Cronobacter sakazakii]|nr:manganase accumulation protein MntS [Cronobacter sakazakii]